MGRACQQPVLVCREQCTRYTWHRGGGPRVAAGQGVWGGRCGEVAASHPEVVVDPMLALLEVGRAVFIILRRSN